MIYFKTKYKKLSFFCIIYCQILYVHMLRPINQLNLQFPDILQLIKQSIQNVRRRRNKRKENKRY